MYPIDFWTLLLLSSILKVLQRYFMFEHNYIHNLDLAINIIHKYVFDFYL